MHCKAHGKKVRIRHERKNTSGGWIAVAVYRCSECGEEISQGTLFKNDTDVLMRVGTQQRRT